MDKAIYRAMRVGGAFGWLHHVSPELSVHRERLGSTRCDARLPRSAFVALPLGDDEAAEVCRPHTEPDRHCVVCMRLPCPRRFFLGSVCVRGVCPQSLPSKPPLEAP